MSQNWEEIHKKRDQEVVEKIERCNTRSNIFLFIGIGSFVLGLSAADDILKNFFQGIIDQYQATGTVVAEEMFSTIKISSIILLILFILLGMFFLFQAMLNWEKSEKLSASRFLWIPDEEEIRDINERFDNEMIRSLIASIPPVDTKSMEVGFDAVTIRTNEGVFACYFNQQGYEQLDNYGTKRLAYYLASNCFLAGFVIYQKKIAPIGSDRYLGGVTDIGGELPPREKMIKRYFNMYSWLAVRIQDTLKLGTGLKMPEQEDTKSPTNDGQIVLNKGYSSIREGLKPL